MKNIILVVGGFVFSIVLLTSFSVVGVGERGVRVTLGKASDQVVPEGLTLKIPVIQIIKKFDVKTVKVEQKAISYSKDIQTVDVGAALNFHVNPDGVVRLYKEIGTDFLTRIILPAIQESVKSTTAQYTAQELVEKREMVKSGIIKELSDRLSAKYLVVDDFSITNFDFSDAYEQAIEAKQTAQQNALKAENDLKRIKIEAEQKIAQARAEAEAIRISAEAIRNQGGAEYVNLKAVEKWNGVLPVQMIPGQTVPFINLTR